MSISNIILSNKLLSQLACFVYRMKSHEYDELMNLRSNINIFDYKNIALPLPKHYDEICPDNNCFGIGWSIRQYAGWTKCYMNQFVEHGYFYGTYVSEQEISSFARTIMTFGDRRKEAINAKCSKNVVPIGPYIHYAPDYYTEEQFFAAKNELGKTLLVFFSHASTGQTVDFDLEFMISKIEMIRSMFDSVVISLFWSDINEEKVQRLTSMGYKIFSSGHRYDYLFLSRQKTMIKLADFTMSNSVGTHIAYCTYLKKPHWLIRQKVVEKAFNKIGEKNLAVAKWQSEDQKNHEELESIYNMFTGYSEVLTEEQYNFASEFYGFDYIRSKEEMKKILSED